MNSAVQVTPEEPLYRLPETVSWRDTDTDCTIVLAQPDLEPELWEQYLDGAVRSYRKHGVECALDLESFRDGRDTTLFYTALDDSGRMVGGLRAKGPYFGAEESHALVEWEGHPDDLRPAAVRCG
jgi:hypothetical protein